MLEIGCGTGKLTEMLVARGLAVDAVDPGPQLVEAARRRVGDGAVRFHLGRFEDIELPPGSFEAVFSGTAFHWVDPGVGWRKVAELLVPLGVLALLQTGLPELSSAELAAWRRVWPDARTWESRDPYDLWRGVEERLGNVSELWSWLLKRDLTNPVAASLFAEVRLLTAPTPCEQTTDTYLAVLRTTSTYLRLDPSQRAVLDGEVAVMIDAAGGIQRWLDTATLVTVRRASVLG